MRLLQTFLLSIGIHLLLMLILSYLDTPEPRTSNAVVVDFEPSTKAEHKQIVRAAILPDKYKVQSTEDKLKFLSDKFQRVQQQSRAALSGLTANRGAKNSQKNEAQKPHKVAALDALAPKYKISAHESQVNDIDGPSTISDSMNELKVGQVTALNTDQYLFYSFFERVSSLVYIRWVTLIRSAEENLVSSRINYNSNNTWTTQVEILLKPTGEFITGHILKPSGIPEFDRAAVGAFAQAKMFPNPPKELIDPDGHVIRLKYALAVYFDPKVLVSK